MSLKEDVLKAVLEGCTTSKEILSKIGKNISSAKAATRGRSCAEADIRRGHIKKMPSVRSLIVWGRTNMVLNQLRSLCKSGKIRKIKPGVYGPP